MNIVIMNVIQAPRLQKSSCSTQSINVKLNFQLYNDYIPPQMNIFIAMNDIWIQLLIGPDVIIMLNSN